MRENIAKQKSYRKRPELEKWTINRCLRMEKKEGTEGEFEGERDKCEAEESKRIKRRDSLHTNVLANLLRRKLSSDFKIKAPIDCDIFARAISGYYFILKV